MNFVEVCGRNIISDSINTDSNSYHSRNNYVLTARRTILTAILFQNKKLYI